MKGSLEREEGGIVKEPCDIRAPEEKQMDEDGNELLNWRADEYGKKNVNGKV